MIKKLGLGCGGLIVVLVILSAVMSQGQKPVVTPAATSAPAAGAPAAPKAEPTAVQVPKVGDTISKGNWEYQVTKVEDAKTVTWSEFGNTTDAKGIFKVVQVKLKNIGKETYPINSFDFEIKDGAGITYKSDMMTSSSYSKFKKLSAPGESYPPGVPAEIALVFDVNPDAKGFMLNLVQAKTLVDLNK